MALDGLYCADVPLSNYSLPLNAFQCNFAFFSHFTNNQLIFLVTFPAAVSDRIRCFHFFFIFAMTIIFPLTISVCRIFTGFCFWGCGLAAGGVD